MHTRERAHIGEVTGDNDDDIKDPKPYITPELDISDVFLDM